MIVLRARPKNGSPRAGLHRPPVDACGLPHEAIRIMKQIPIWLLFGALSLAACTSRPAADTETIYVSIPPLKSLVEAIVGDDYPVEVLVPAGASPETFEPTPRQYVAVNRARRLFQIGLIDFERNLVARIADPAKVVELGAASGVELLTGSCSHGHGSPHDGHAHDAYTREAHAHGVDPHLWSSPRALRGMAAAIYAAIHADHPDSVRYTRNHERLQQALAELDARTAERIARSGIRTVFVYHPALSYYARDYGLEQIAVEQEGKEPSARHLAQLIRRARAEAVDRILYQVQFPRSSVEAIAADIGAEAVAFDPLAEDAIGNIDRITALITKP